LSNLSKHQEDLAKKRRAFTQARAIIQRGKNAGIPDKYLRVKETEFSSLLCDKFHGDVKKFSKLVYSEPGMLFKKSFIVIDGGDNYKRKKAGFAILFRMIACDKFGKYYDCKQLSGEFQTIKGSYDYRNDIIKDVKREGILFINEFNPKNFSAHFDSGMFFDQLLEHRDDYSKPTIITFSYPLEKGMLNRGNAIKDDRCGSYLSMLSHSDINKNENVLRIKLK
jgi:hypothetical protein